MAEAGKTSGNEKPNRRVYKSYQNRRKRVRNRPRLPGEQEEGVAVQEGVEEPRLGRKEAPVASGSFELSVAGTAQAQGHSETCREGFLYFQAEGEFYGQRDCSG